jgi:hypothetical protein
MGELDGEEVPEEEGDPREDGCGRERHPPGGVHEQVGKDLPDAPFLGLLSRHVASICDG